MFETTRKLIVASLVLVLTAGYATIVSAQAVEAEVDNARQRLEEARAAHMQLISPRNFERAAKALDEADAKYSQAGKIEDIRRKLTEVKTALDSADRLRELGELTLGDALAARSDALASNAPQFAAKLWGDAEKAIRDAGRKIEDGDQRDASKLAGKALTGYREAELLSIRTDILGTARSERETAVLERAEERAAITLGRADKLLEQAEQVLQGDRYQRAEARKLAERATEEYKHSVLIARRSLEIDKDRKRAPEQLILGYETQAARVAEALRYEPAFSEGMQAVADQMVAAVNSILEDRTNMQQQLTNERSQVDSLETRLASLSERDAELSLREKRERRLRAVQGTFGTQEAEVLLRANQLIIRLYGLSFPVGSAEIRPDNFSLLTKLQRVLREYPNSPAAIEGHTDSQGNEDYNQALSQRRADAVREYLLANMSIEPEAIAALGFGESRPIANNETEEGRAKNRRIDIVVDLASSSLAGY